MLAGQPVISSTPLLSRPFYPSSSSAASSAAAVSTAGPTVSSYPLSASHLATQQVHSSSFSSPHPSPPRPSDSQALGLAMTNHGDQITPDTDEDSFHFGEGSESPSQGAAAGGDRPRVRAEGPGGQDLKRGARIACLECRSAKIRCSAPSDGQVPCKRCSRHDKECVFEKHRRGRKPGRGNLPKDRSNLDGKSAGHPTPYRNTGGDRPTSDISSASSSYQSPNQWTPANGPQGSKPSAPMHQHPAPMQTSSPFGSSPAMSSRDPYRPELSPYGTEASHPSPMSRPGPSQPSRAYPGPLPHFPSRDQHFGYQTRHLQSPYEMPGPLVSSQGHGYQAPLSSASASSSHGGGFFSPPLPRAEMSPFPGPQQIPGQRDDHRWGPNNVHNSSSYRGGYGNARALASDRSPKRQSEGQGHPQQTVMGPPTQMGRNQNSEVSSPRTLAPFPHQFNSSSKLNPASHGKVQVQSPPQEVGTVETEEEEEDELVDEDEVIGAYQDPDVLSRPLQLLAYASTAAARRQTAGGYKDPRSMTAAATLGLISGTAAEKVKNDLEVAAQKATTEPASLGAGGAEPSTLENGNWEYKSGRVRAIRGSDASQSPASIDESAKGADIIYAASNSTREEESGALEDSGPHLGKRRRSDDEALPLPVSRRQSTVAEQRRMSKLVTTDRHKSEPDVPMEGDSDDESEEQERAPAGASRKGYFRFSLYASKPDIDDANDPVSLEILSLKEMEDSFDFFFNRINPSNFLFDPFLHSLAYIRARSKFLLTVIGSHAARMSEGPRSAELAEKLEEHWRVKLLPEILMGGFKSVEIAQAFLLASLFHRPTHIIVEDRAWQYLGFAIRTATEVGVNISLAPNTEAQDNEHLSRRLRNRDRLWLSLVIAEGTLSTQFGRPCTLLVKHSVSQSSWWNREDFALPEDAALMCQIELRRIVEHRTSEFHRVVATLPASTKESSERITKLEALHKLSWQELEAWMKTWCPTGGLDQAGVGGSMAMGAFLVRWSPYSRLIYYYWRCHLNSFILQAASRRTAFSSRVAFDSMQCARHLMAILLDENQVGAQGLALAPNGVVVMAIYAAVSALRLTKLDLSKHAFIDQRTIFDQVHRLAESLEVAGKTPEHRDGAAAPYGTYLLSVLALFDGDSKTSSAASVASEVAGAGRGGTDGTPTAAMGMGGDRAPSATRSGTTSTGGDGGGPGLISSSTAPGTVGDGGLESMPTADQLALLAGASATPDGAISIPLSGTGSGVLSSPSSASYQQPKSLSAQLTAFAPPSSSATAAGGGPNGDALAFALSQTQNAQASAAAATAAALLQATSHPEVVEASLPNHHYHPHPHHHQHHHHHNGGASSVGGLDDLSFAGVYASDSEVWGYLGGSGGGGGGGGITGTSTTVVDPSISFGSTTTTTSSSSSNANATIPTTSTGCIPPTPATGRTPGGGAGAGTIQAGLNNVPVPGAGDPSSLAFGVVALNDPANVLPTSTTTTTATSLTRPASTAVGTAADTGTGTGENVGGPNVWAAHGGVPSGWSSL